MNRRDTLDLLDDQALRDLGLDRSELPSLAAESAGIAALTRRRVVRPARVVAATRARRHVRSRVGAVLAWCRRLVPFATAVLAVAAVSTTVRGTPADATTPVSTPCCAGTSQRSDAADASYFPSQFAPPAGEIEPLPSQF